MICRVPSADSLVGSIMQRWMPPEVCLSRPYGLKADVYSFGLLLWSLLSLEVPFGCSITPQIHLKQVVKVRLHYAPEPDTFPRWPCCSIFSWTLLETQGGKRPRVPSFAPKSVRQLLKSCWHVNADRRPKLGAVCLNLRDEISGFSEKKSSRSLMERTQHLRFYSKRSLRTAWEALGLPASSHRLGMTKPGEPSTELRPITEHDPTETSELSLLSRLQYSPSAAASSTSDEWQVRHLFGSALQCEMPSSWTDLSWNATHVPENRELWQDGEGDARENCTVLFKAEIREQVTDFRASIGFYYAEAADAGEVDYEHRQWSHFRSDDLVAPSGSKLISGLGTLVLPQESKALRVEVAVLRRADDKSPAELVITLYSALDPADNHEDDSLLSPTFQKFVKSIQFTDLNAILRAE
jgi:Protein tyrosine and serine/threonine kinase